MSLNRSTAILVLMALASLLASTASAQSYRIGDLQLFRPYDDSEYGGALQPSRGFYFSMDYVAIEMSRPRRATVGANITRQVFSSTTTTGTPPTIDQNFFALTPSSPTLDTGAFDSNWHSGLRTDIGYIAEDGGGWNLSTLVVHGKSQFINAQGAVVNFVDPNDLVSTTIGTTDPTNPNGLPTLIRADLPEQFDTVLVRLKTNVTSTDAQRTWRTEGGVLAGWLDWGLGLRYFTHYDKFLFSGSGGTLDATTVSQRANNNILGPQFSLRWFTMADRWMYSADLRLVPALNAQYVNQNSIIGSNIGTVTTGGTGTTTLQPGFLSPTGSNSQFRAVVFSPVVNIRVNISYRVTDYVSVRAGANVIYVDGLARSPDMINWQIPNPSIFGQNNKQGEILYGITFGVEINR